jgi:predicted Zn-dependent protease
MERFEKAVRPTPPGHLGSRYDLAVQFLARDRIDDAIPLLQQAAAVRPNHELLNVTLGTAYLLAGRGEDAYKSFLLGRRLYPANRGAPLELAVLHARAKQPDEARHSLDVALELGGTAARQRAGAFPVLQPLLAASGG